MEPAGSIKPRKKQEEIEKSRRAHPSKRMANNVSLECVQKQLVSYSWGKEKETALIHSERSGIILWGKRFVYVYQPLWSNGPENIDQYRHFLESEFAITTISPALIIGGDHNAHIGGQARENMAPPLQQMLGKTHLDWCKANELQWVNSSFNIKKKEVVHQKP